MYQASDQSEHVQLELTSSLAGNKAESIIYIAGTAWYIQSVCMLK